MNNNEFTIITFYQFKKINNLEKLRIFLKDFCFFNKIRGTILLADEGINGTIAGFYEPINNIRKKFEELGFNKLEIKISSYEYMPFNRLKIKIKKEIVTFDGNYYDVSNSTAHHVDNKKWNNLINNHNTIVLDVRNDFEYRVCKMFV